MDPEREQSRQVVVFVRVNNLTNYTVERQETFTIDSHGPADLDTVIVGALNEAAAQINAR